MNAAGLKNKFINIIQKQEYLFLILVLLTGIAMACINPPFQECDGWDHFIRAMDVSYGNILSPVASLNHDAGAAIVPENLNECNYYLVEPRSGEGAAYNSYLKSIHFSDNKVEMTYWQGTTSFLYYPQAIGLFIGRHLNLSIYGCVFLSRLFNLFAFAALAFFAIRLTPVLKNSLMVLALFPMTVYQAASDSPDALLNGMCFLFVALCLYHAFGKKERLGWRDMIWLGVLLGLIFMCKYIYVCLGLLVFMIPRSRFETGRNYWKSFLIAIIPIVIFGVVAVMSAASAVSSGQASNDAGMSQMEYLMHNPSMIVKVLFNTFMLNTQAYMTWLNTLGSLNYPLGPLIFIVPMFIMYVLAGDANELTVNIKLKDKLLALAAFLVICIGIVVGIYIGDGRINPIGAETAEGVQGRYFIPAIPLLFVFLAPVKHANNDTKYKYKVFLFQVIILALAVFGLKANCL